MHRTARILRPSTLRINHARPNRALGILSPSKRKSEERIAVLHQSVDPPVVNGVRKPKKQGGALLDPKLITFDH